MEFEPSQQRLIETGVRGTEYQGECIEQPSLIVAECMRGRGWEVTNCSGRMPIAGGAAVCAIAVQ
jgi:hypothetical protein